MSNNHYKKLAIFTKLPKMSDYHKIGICHKGYSLPMKKYLSDMLEGWLMNFLNDDLGHLRVSTSISGPRLIWVKIRNFIKAIKVSLSHNRSSNRHINDTKLQLSLLALTYIYHPLIDYPQQMAQL